MTPSNRHQAQPQIGFLTTGGVRRKAQNGSGRPAALFPLAAKSVTFQAVTHVTLYVTFLPRAERDSDICL
jgi:hypothetical protein